MIRYIVNLCGCMALVASVHTAQAEVKPASVFGDHMVLQRQMTVPVWGTAEPGEDVRVEQTTLS